MAQEDLQALIAFLRTLKAVRKPTPELQASIPLLRSVATEGWLKAFGQFYRAPRVRTRTRQIPHGARRDLRRLPYAEKLHRYPEPARFIWPARAGKIGPLGQLVPDITPDKDTGIGSWTRDDIAELLRKGTKPDLDYVRGLMFDVIEGTSHGYRNMSREDALAIADYLKSIPALKNKIK